MELWRPSEHVRHLLTECKQQPVIWSIEEQQQQQANAEEELARKRQAPSVWRPPVAIKPKTLPIEAPADDWQLPREQPKLEPFPFMGQPISPDEEEAKSNSPEDSNAEEQKARSTREEQPAPTTTTTTSSSSGKLFSFTVPAPTSNPFNIKQQLVPQTPLFSGLGSVSFTSGSAGFSVPTSSIFGQSSAFGLGFQKPALSEKGTAVSEKGSSDSSSKKNTKVPDVQSKNGGFKPSGLSGKSLVNSSSTAELPTKDQKAGTSKDQRTPTPPRKLRTRPLDLLMNAIQATAPKTRNSAGPQTRNSKKSAKETNAEPEVKRAYFPHTGAWIVQKKSSRKAKNAFKRELSDSEPSRSPSPTGHKGPSPSSNGHKVTKKRSLTAMSHPEKSEDDPVIKSKRGRSQVLPTRLRDSVITASHKVKKSSRK